MRSDELTLSVYDDYTGESERIPEGEGFFSPFTFLCFSLVLLFFGLISLFSASMDDFLSSGRAFWSAFASQGAGALSGIAFGIVLALLPEKAFLRIHYLGIPVSIALTIATAASPVSVSSVLAPVAGSFSAFFLAFFLSHLLPCVENMDRRGFGFIGLSLFTLSFMALVTAGCGSGWFPVLLFVAATVLWSRGVRKGFLLFLVVSALLVFAFVILLSPSLLRDFSMSTMPVPDPGYYSRELAASVAAIRDGGLYGAGLGEGLYKLGVIHSPEGELILATVMEETGIIGLSVILISLVMVSVVAVRTAGRARRLERQWDKTLILAVTASLVMPFFMNMLRALGLNPFGGVYLPLFSYSPFSEGVYVLSLSVLYVFVVRYGRRKEDEE